MSASTSAAADRIDEEPIDDDVATAMREMLDQVEQALEDEDDGRRDDEVDLRADEALDMGMGAYEDCRAVKRNEARANAYVHVDASQGCLGGGTLHMCC